MTHAARPFLRQSCLSGTVCGLMLSTVVGLTSRLTTGRSSLGLNAISHIVWGPKAARQTSWTSRYTGTGLLLNQGACLFWAGCYEALLRKQPPHSVTKSVADAMKIAALAYVVDYHVIPKRFTPGFEFVFPRRLFPLLYVGLAASLFAGATFCARRPRSSAENPS